jgi:hypothetical protein
MMTGFEQYTRKTRRAIFLEEREQVVPWHELCALVEPHYLKAGTGGRRRESSGCCEFTFCSSGSTCRTRWSKRRCNDSAVMRPSWALIWAVSRCR